MRQVYLGNTLINDAFLGNDRMDNITRNTGQLTIEYLIVAGGGGSSDGGGGGGGVLTGSTNLISDIIYDVYVAPSVGRATNGNNSYFSGSGVNLNAIGGGRGASGVNDAQIGGSGGGGRGDRPGAAGTVGQGNSGGNGTGGFNTGGGGGGAASAGTNSTSTLGGNGGNGIASSIDGTLRYYGAGGGGRTSGGVSGTPGLGANGANLNAPINSGAGLSFCDDAGPFSAGSGYIVLKYFGDETATGGRIVKDGNFTLHIFENTGADTFVIY